MENSHQVEVYMRRALELATLGNGAVSPNPLVGCVLVAHGRIIGEGWHQRYGQAHAEVNAIRDAEANGYADLFPEATAFVTLEPCSHFGKTPPCADLLIEKKIKKVFVCNVDPNPLVSGRGIQKLRDAGIEVEVGVLEAEGHWLSRRFFTSIEKKRPYLLLKWAETGDGFIGTNDGVARQISNELSRTWVHKFRSELDAVLVGTTTAANDNPRLNVRLWSGRSPVRVVIDQNLRLPTTLHVFDESQKTLIYNRLRDDRQGEIKYCSLDFNTNWPFEMVRDLHQMQIQSVLIEGGTQVLQSFIQLGLFDEIIVFKSHAKLHEGVKAPELPHSIQLRQHKKYLSDDFFQYVPIQTPF